MSNEEQTSWTLWPFNASEPGDTIPVAVDGRGYVGHVHLTQEVSDWLNNPPAGPDDDQRTIALEAPIMKNGQEVAKAVLRPKVSEDGWHLSLAIRW